MGHKVTIHCLVLWIIFVYTCGQTYDNMKSLRSTLLTGYDPDIIPLNSQSQIMNINVTMILYSIREADSVNGILKTVTATLLTWVDEKLTWTPSDYGNINKMLIKQELVWTPTISVANPTEFFVMGKSWMHVNLYSTGFVTFFPGDLIASACTFNMKFWPFDKQICEISFFVFDHQLDTVLLQTPPGGFITQYLSPNGEWTLEEASSYQSSISGFSQAVFRMKLKRQSMFFVMSIILPLIGLGLLNPLVYFLPSESGERVSYSITILLAITVFLTVISDMMPNTSDPIALICIFVTFSMGSSIMCTLSVILNLAIYHRSEATEKGPFYKMLVRVTSFQNCRKNKVSDITMHEDGENHDDKNYDKSVNKRFMHKTKSTDFIIQQKHKTLPQKSQSTDVVQNINDLMSKTDITWKDVSFAIDKILFLTVLLTMVIPVVTFLVYLPVASDYTEP